MRVVGRRAACSLALALVLGVGSTVAQYDITEFDADESGALEPKEFAKFLQTTPAKGQPKDQIRQMFKRINTSKCDQTVCVDARAIALSRPAGTCRQ
jgi:Ca2+-binding EF-hand superfamily protein